MNTEQKARVILSRIKQLRPKEGLNYTFDKNQAVLRVVFNSNFKTITDVYRRSLKEILKDNFHLFDIETNYLKQYRLVIYIFINKIKDNAEN